MPSNSNRSLILCNFKHCTAFKNESLFKLVDKADPNVVTFDEFLPACCAFALFTRPEMIAFIFNMLDLDQDKILSKVDLLQFSQQVRGGKKNKK